MWTISIHGPTRVRRGADEVGLRPRERAVVAALALGHPVPLPLIRVAELVWGLDIPQTYNKSLHNHVSRIRRAAPGLIETVDGGYRLSDTTKIDRSRSGTTPTVPFADLADSAEMHEQRAHETFQAQQDEDARLLAAVDRQPAEAMIAVLRSAVTIAPLNEMRWRLLVLALAHTGQRRKALVALRDASTTFSSAGLDFGSELRDLERRVFDDDVTLRGPIQASVAIAPDRATPLSRTIRLDEYRAQILPLLEEAAATSTIALTGPAGIGKSTMAEAIRELAQAEGFSVYWTTCSAEPTVAFEPFVDLLDQLSERHRDALRRCDGVELLSNLVPGLAPGASEPTGWADRDALFDAIAAALRVDPRPTLFVIEDLHWASPYTLRLLRHCQTAALRALPLVFVCTSRSAIEHPDDTTTIEVERWSAAETAAYLSLCDPTGPHDDGRAEWIHRETGGVALHVRELTLAVLNDPQLLDQGADVSPVLSPSLVAHLDAQRRELSAPAQRLLAAAAVLGKSFAVPLLDAMVVDAPAALAEAAEADILVPVAETDRYQFRHDLLHRVARDAMSPGMLVEFHDLAVRALEGSPGAPVGELARHASAAASVDRARAVRHLLAAADVAAEQYAHEQAIAGYTAARELLATGSEQWCEATLAAGRLMARIGDARAQSFLRGAAEQATHTGEQDLLARAVLEVCRLGPTSIVGEVDDRAEALVEGAMRVVTEPGPRSMVATAAVGVYLVSGQPDRCRQYYLEAVGNADLAGDRDILANALAVSVLALVGPDDLPRRLEAAHRLERIGRESGSPLTLFSGLHLRMSNEVQTGDPNMRETLAELEELAAIVHQRSRDWEVTNWQATLALIDGDLARAEARATAALEYGDAVAPSVVAAAYGAVLLGIRLAAGRAGELVELLRSTLEQQPTFGAWHATIAAAASTDDPALANHHLDLVLADDCAVLTRDFTFSTALWLAAHAAHDLERFDAADTLGPLLLPWSGTWVWMGTATFGPVDQGLARLAALAGDVEGARSWGRAALEQCERAGAPLHHAAATRFLDELPG